MAPIQPKLVKVGVALIDPNSVESIEYTKGRASNVYWYILHFKTNPKPVWIREEDMGPFFKATGMEPCTPDQYERSKGRFRREFTK